MIKYIIIISAVLSVFMGTASGLGITHAGFGDVEQGKTYDIPVIVLTSELDFDNYFIIEIKGDLNEWVSVTPMEFDLPAGESQTLTVNLEVPENARLGEYKGSITAVGQKGVPAPGETSGGAAVGYTIAARSLLSATVTKPGAVESIAITHVDAPARVKPDSVVKFDISIKNTGNVPAIATPTLLISNKAGTTEIPGVPVELEVGEGTTTKLYWDAQEDGTYTAVVSIVCGGTTVDSDPISITVTDSSLPGMQAYSVIIAILGAALLLRRRS
jgi:hypothetical protein